MRSSYQRVGLYPAISCKRLLPAVFPFNFLPRTWFDLVHIAYFRISPVASGCLRLLPCRFFPRFRRGDAGGVAAALSGRGRGPGGAGGAGPARLRLSPSRAWTSNQNKPKQTKQTEANQTNRSKPKQTEANRSNEPMHSELSRKSQICFCLRLCALSCSGVQCQCSGWQVSAKQSPVPARAQKECADRIARVIRSPGRPTALARAALWCAAALPGTARRGGEAIHRQRSPHDGPALRVHASVHVG